VESYIAEEDVLGQVATWCQAHNLDLGLWLVGLHNSALGQDRPELCVRNCFNDVYPYNLCPSKPPVRAYLRGLIQDVCDQFGPQRILLETAGWLGLLHWVHHEKVGIPVGEAAEMLLFLCFCPDCLARATQAGVDGPAVQEQVAAWTQSLLADERGALSAGFTIADMPALLLEAPELYRYIQMRIDTTTTLVGDLQEITSKADTKLEVMPSAWGNPVARAWREGMSLRHLAKVCDGLIPLAYYADPRETRADIRWIQMLGDDLPLSVGLTACHPVTDSAATLVANAQTCAQEGAAGIYYYNYGMLNQERLDWVRQANAAS
jgi:hypothetical protein